MSDEEKKKDEKLIKVYNTTDLETPLLKQHGMVNVTFVAGKAMVSPGAMVEVADDAMLRSHLTHYVAIGAASIDRLPQKYVMSKDLKKRTTDQVPAPEADSLVPVVTETVEKFAEKFSDKGGKKKKE